MQMNNKKRELIKNTLLNNMSVLEEMLGGNSEMKRKAIQLNIETLKLGWIHIACRKTPSLALFLQRQTI